MKTHIFRMKKGGGSYFLVDSRGVKWNIEKHFLPKVSGKGKSKGVSFWTAESENEEHFRENLKRTLLTKIESLSKVA